MLVLKSSSSWVCWSPSPHRPGFVGPKVLIIPGWLVLNLLGYLVLSLRRITITLLPPSLLVSHLQPLNVLALSLSGLSRSQPLSLSFGISARLKSFRPLELRKSKRYCTRGKLTIKFWDRPNWLNQLRFRPKPKSHIFFFFISITVISSAPGDNDDRWLEPKKINMKILRVD